MKKKEKEVTDINTISGILAEGTVCHLAFSDEPAPYIVAMNYGFCADDKVVMYFHTAKTGKKLDLLKKNNYVCFQVDTGHRLVGGKTACSYTMEFKSVVGYGHLSMVDDKEEKKDALDRIMQQYTGKAAWNYPCKMLEATCILKLVATGITGKISKK